MHNGHRFGRGRWVEIVLHDYGNHRRLGKENPRQHLDNAPAILKFSCPPPIQERLDTEAEGLRTSEFQSGSSLMATSESTRQPDVVGSLVLTRTQLVGVGRTLDDLRNICAGKPNRAVKVTNEESIPSSPPFPSTFCTRHKRSRLGAAESREVLLLRVRRSPNIAKKHPVSPYRS